MPPPPRNFFLDSSFISIFNNEGSGNNIFFKIWVRKFEYGIELPEFD